MVSKVGKRYALSILEAAGDQKKVTEVLSDFELIEKVLSESKPLVALLKNPIVKSDKKIAVFTAIFEKKVQPVTMLMLKILAHKGRIMYLPEIIEGFKHILDEQNGITTIEVAAAFELDQVESDALRKKLESYTSKKVRINFSLDKQMIGGMTVKIDDTVIDGSVRHKLELLKEKFTEEILN